MRFAGIDVGGKRSGAVAVIDTGPDGRVVSAVTADLPFLDIGRTSPVLHVADLVAVMAAAGAPDYTVVEGQGYRPGDRLSQVVPLVALYARLMGVLAALQWPHRDVFPQTWQKATIGDAGRSVKDSDKRREAIKAAVVAWATQTYPKVKLPGDKKKRSGHADALALADWGRRHYQGASQPCPSSDQGTSATKS